MPRHPPCALTHLPTTKLKIAQNQPHTNHHHQRRRRHAAIQMLATTIHNSNTTPHHQDEATTHKRVASGPNSVSDDSPPTPQTPTGRPFVVHPARATTARTPQWLTPRTVTGCLLVVLLRKEVIQPHLPVRLPCYDFVPIADPTFDSSPPQRVRPLASGVTDFHDVTGGVYKARERIHRSVADLRLLATPTSRGRVADPDPN
jgi:hypothetical protein